MISRLRAIIAAPPVRAALALAAASWGVAQLGQLAEALHREIGALGAEADRRRRAIDLLRTERLSMIRDLGTPAPGEDAAAAAYRDALRRQGAVCLTCAGPWPCMSHPAAAGVDRSLRRNGQTVATGGHLVTPASADGCPDTTHEHVDDVDQAAAAAPAP
jgi:hypothetical protein